MRGWKGLACCLMAASVGLAGLKCQAQHVPCTATAVGPSPRLGRSGAPAALPQDLAESPRARPWAGESTRAIRVSEGQEPDAPRRSASPHRGPRRAGGQAPKAKDPEPLPQLEIIPHATISDQLLAHHRNNPDAEDSLHLHYRGYQRPMERAPFYVRINGPSPGTPNPRWRSLVPRVEILNQDGQPHAELWAGYYGLGRFRPGGGQASTRRTIQPPSAVDRGEAAEFAFLLLGEHRPWEHLECTVRAYTEEASTTLDVILTPAFPYESIGFGNAKDSGPWCLLQVPSEIPVSDVELQLSHRSTEIGATETWTKLLVQRPEFPRFGYRTLSSHRVMSWTWNVLPKPLEDASLRIRVRFPNGFVYDRTLVPGQGGH